MTKIQVIDGQAYRLVKIGETPVGRPKNKLSPALKQTLLFQRNTMTVKEMAAYYDKSESTLNRWLREARDSNGKEKTQS